MPELDEGSGEPLSAADESQTPFDGEATEGSGALESGVLAPDDGTVEETGVGVPP